MFYSNIDIQKAIADNRIEVSPIEEKQIQPASIDLRIGNQYFVPQPKNSIDFSSPIVYKEFVGEQFLLRPKCFVLATTIEKIKLPADIVAFVQGRSSIGRMGLFIQNAGWVDPGFSGQITLELFNAGNSAILIPEGRRICQIVLAETKTPASDGGYSGKYQNQVGTTASRIYQDDEVTGDSKSRTENYILSNENVTD